MTKRELLEFYRQGFRDGLAELDSEGIEKMAGIRNWLAARKMKKLEKLVAKAKKLGYQPTFRELSRATKLKAYGGALGAILAAAALGRASASKKA